ncbi:hypothetical protein Q8A67_015923 [Cirrhinus molitorella]|uniref:Uncharacterized protein n=1 Tax=Cirrhinus molitorella TaxID=172907 RepID=A0AA88PUE6_9TELE|nr:hypothetical protein Q8A67_015923 [Cirrhinus molitorella]
MRRGETKQKIYRMDWDYKQPGTDASRMLLLPAVMYFIYCGIQNSETTLEICCCETSCKPLTCSLNTELPVCFLSLCFSPLRSLVFSPHVSPFDQRLLSPPRLSVSRITC